MAAAWSASEAKQAWYDGYYPLDRGQEWLPAGFRGMADKAAYWSGHLDVPAASVTSPASGEVAWTDGSRLTVPLIPAAQLLYRLTNTGVQCSNHCDARLSAAGPGRTPGAGRRLHRHPGRPRPAPVLADRDGRLP